MHLARMVLWIAFTVLGFAWLEKPAWLQSVGRLVEAALAITLLVIAAWLAYDWHRGFDRRKDQ